MEEELVEIIELLCIDVPGLPVCKDMDRALIDQLDLELEEIQFSSLSNKAMKQRERKQLQLQKEAVYYKEHQSGTTHFEATKKALVQYRIDKVR